MLVLVLISVLTPGSWSLGDYLTFPAPPSVNNHVTLPAPDLTSLTTALSACSWVRPRYTGNVYGTWLYYPSSGGAEIRATDGGGNAMFGVDLGAASITPDTWTLYCLTWDLLTHTARVYLDGEELERKVMSSTRSLLAGGALVLGQEGAQGSNSKKLAFSGDLYNLNLFNKRLSGDEVTAMFTAGRCGMVDMALNDSLVVTWSDFLAAPRGGGVHVVQGSCSQWELLRGVIGDQLLDHLIEYHPSE